MTNCCDANGNCNQGRDCPVRRRHTDRTANGTEPTAPLDDIEVLLTTSELAIVCVVLTMLTGVWLSLLFFVSGYAWERWVGEFFMRATGWLLLP